MAVNLHTTHFRFGNDDGTESSHTFKAAEDTNISLNKDTTFLLRFTVQETGGTAAANTDNRFQVSKNGGAFQDITTSSTIVKAVAVAAFAEADNCTKRLSGTGTFESSGAGCTEDGLSGGNANDIAASGNSETECGLQVVGADTVNGDVLTFRITSPDFTVTNDVVPTLTVLHNVTATPALGQPTLTGFAPTVTVTSNQRVTPALGQITVSGFAPTVTVSDNKVSTPGLGEPTLTGLVPTALVSVTAFTDVGALSVNGFAPSVQVSDNQVAIPGAGVLTLTGAVPSAQISDNQMAAPGIGALAVTGFSPTILISVTAFVDTGALDVTGFESSVQISDNQVSTPGLGQIQVDGFAPTVELPVVATPGLGLIIITAFEPTIEVSEGTTPGTGLLVLTGFAPSLQISDHKVVTPGLGILVVTGFAPTVSVGVTANCGTGALIVTGLAPTVTITSTVNVTPGYSELTLFGFSPRFLRPVSSAGIQIITTLNETRVHGLQPREQAVLDLNVVTLGRTGRSNARRELILSRDVSRVSVRVLSGGVPFDLTGITATLYYYSCTYYTASNRKRVLAALLASTTQARRGEMHARVDTVDLSPGSYKSQVELTLASGVVVKAPGEKPLMLSVSHA